MNHCQICGREIKAKSGIIAHHGYKKPEQGWQTDSCMGARQLPYEKSRDIIPLAIVKIDLFIGLTRGKIKQIESENLPIPFIKRMINLDNPMYKQRQKEHIEGLKSQIAMAQRDRERLQKIYDNWKLVEVAQ
ncbi:MAG: hypothetical protein AABY22_31795 [Nanoarchaeota archaeon]